jgi:hypothetical protein
MLPLVVFSCIIPVREAYRNVLKRFLKMAPDRAGLLRRARERDTMKQISERAWEAL